jgi:hypothetical protein
MFSTVESPSKVYIFTILLLLISGDYLGRALAGVRGNKCF